MKKPTYESPKIMSEGSRKKTLSPIREPPVVERLLTVSADKSSSYVKVSQIVHLNAKPFKNIFIYKSFATSTFLCIEKIRM